MTTSRRKFIKLALNSAILIGTGNVLQSFSGSSFALPPRRKVKLRFAIASDGHFGQKDTASEAKHEDMVNWINAEHASRGLDFAFINGDLYHDEIAFLPVVKQYWDKLAIPYHISHGNHDHCTEEDWETAWGKPWDYGFEHGKSGFIVLNTADDTGQYICPDPGKTKQLLTKYQQHGELFVFMHITPFKWTGAGIDCPEIVAMINQQENLKAIFHGHDHDQDNVKESGGKHYFFDSHIAGNWGTEYRGYRIVEVLKNGDVVTYQMNPAAKLQVNNTMIA
jgi:DNA repair exonuclease SbcCD nuclease subunit